MRISVVTLFPDFVREAVKVGVVGRALERGLITVTAVNPRDFATDVHRSVDDRPYGGGPGMVLMPDPLSAALASARQQVPADSRVIYLGAEGRPLTQERVADLARMPGMILLAGRYEGVDERLLQSEIDERISIGDYVVSGGELPALIMVDAVTRLLPGVLGDAESAGQDSFSEGILDWPHYTRPEVWRGQRVPDVLTTGNHAAIARWRLQEALARTLRTRPELIERLTRQGGLTREQRELLEQSRGEFGEQSSTERDD
jgi:tRNA (guanine37-N1)-methyltransferase